MIQVLSISLLILDTTLTMTSPLADSASIVMTNDTQQRYHQSNKSLPSQSTSKSNEIYGLSGWKG